MNCPDGRADCVLDNHEPRPTWWDTERCPNCNEHIYCCGCDTIDMVGKDCTHA